MYFHHTTHYCPAPHHTTLIRCMAAGVPASTAAATLTATYGNLDEVKALFAANKGQVII